jgi:hypothetical protein
MNKSVIHRGDQPTKISSNCYGIIFGFELRDIFATNVFPFVKKGDMSASIPKRDLVRAAKDFAIPQIEIVEPLIAVCLGVPAYNALRAAVGIDKIANLEQGIASPFRIGTTEVWCQAHTGQLGRNNRNHGGVDRVNEDWALMAAAHNRLLRLTSKKVAKAAGKGK